MSLSDAIAETFLDHALFPRDSYGPNKPLSPSLTNTLLNSSDVLNDPELEPVFARAVNTNCGLLFGWPQHLTVSSEPL